jgi:hypothetical protein
MLSLEPSTAPDALTDALADLVAVLHPDAGMGSRSAILEASRGSVRTFLRKFRHHLHENSLFIWALKEAEPACFEPLRPIVGAHEILRRLSHDLCRRLRSEDVRRARSVARSLMALLLDHIENERHLLTQTVRGFDVAATSRLADALFKRMLGDMALRQGEAPSRQSVAELHSLYVRLIRHLQGRSADSRPSEVDHEHSCC